MVACGELVHDPKPIGYRLVIDCAWRTEKYRVLNDLEAKSRRLRPGNGNGFAYDRPPVHLGKQIASPTINTEYRILDIAPQTLQ
jgi:hypothetical protein